MQELTDAYLAQNIGSINTAGIMFFIIVLLFVLIIMIRNFSVKRKKLKLQGNNTYKGYGYIIGIIFVILISIFLIFNIGNVSTKGKNSDWYLTTDTVENKYTERDAGAAGVKKTLYYVEVTNEEVQISRDNYDKLNIGNSVYVLRSDDGRALEIYLTSDYYYSGSRMRD